MHQAQGIAHQGHKNPVFHGRGMKDGTGMPQGSTQPTGRPRFLGTSKGKSGVDKHQKGLAEGSGGSLGSVIPLGCVWDAGRDMRMLWQGNWGGFRRLNPPSAPGEGEVKSL